MLAVADEPKPRRGRGRPKLSEEERATRAALVLGARLANKRTEEICAEFRISKATVYRAFDQAKRLGLLEKARDFLTLDLIPLSLAAYEEALRSDNLELKVQVAEKVLEGLGVTGKHATLLLKTSAEPENFDDFRRKIYTSAYGPPQGGDIVEALPPGDESGAAGVSAGIPVSDGGEVVAVAEAGPGARDREGCLPGPDLGDSGADSPRMVTPSAVADQD